MRRCFFIETANVVDTGRVNLGDGVCLWSDPIPIEKITCVAAVSRAYGEHTANVAGGFRFDILFDNQFGTIEGQRTIRYDNLTSAEQQQPSTLTRERLRELGHDINIMDARLVAKVPPTLEEQHEWRYNGTVQLLIRCPQCFACTPLAMICCYRC